MYVRLLMLPIRSLRNENILPCTSESKFIATPEKGDVSALVMRPEGAMHLLVIGHGASTNMRHATLAAISESLAELESIPFLVEIPERPRCSPHAM